MSTHIWIAVIVIRSVTVYFENIVDNERNKREERKTQQIYAKLLQLQQCKLKLGVRLKVKVIFIFDRSDNLL